jgi:hypothetical protein
VKKGGKMPYKRVGSVIYHKKGGTWKIKQRCKSPENAKRALRLLHMKTGH